MRVTHVITRLVVGGAQENTIASVLGLRRKPGLEVDLVSGQSQGREGSLETCFDSDRDALTVISGLVRPVNPWMDWQGYRQLCAHFRRVRPDIVHTHSGKAGILGRWAARTAGVPIVVHSIHGPSFGPFQGVLANQVFRSAEQMAGRWTTHFVVVANAMREQYLAAGIGTPDQYTRIFSGFPLERFLNARRDPVLAQSLGIQPGKFVVGMVARLFKLKGHDDLFDAAPQLVARCPNIQFLLVGDGPWRGRLEERARKLGLADRIRFTGLVPPSSVPDLLAQMDVLVHLSRREGLARVLPQALAAGVPIVAADCDGANEVCHPNQTGFLIQPGDRASLIEHIAKLEQSLELRVRLAEAGRQFVRQRFSVEQLVDDQFDLYHRLARERGLPLRPAAASAASRPA
jgi:glycosyltransferase involved in cell wall biosynthesis